MLSILVGHAYFLNFDRKQQARAKPYPPLATLQVATRLRSQGHLVSLFDAMLAEGTAEFLTHLERVQPQLVLLYEDNYNYLTKMCLARMRAAATEMAGAARRHGARIMVAGSDASDHPATYLQAGADWVLRGEGLVALDQLVQRLDRAPSAPVTQLASGLPDVLLTPPGGPSDDAALADCISGSELPIAEDTVVDRSTSTTRGAMQVLSLPRSPRHAKEHSEMSIAWDLADIESYRAVWLEAHGYFSLNMAASKGCSFRCAWCAKPIWGSRYEQRGALEVAAEMVELKRSCAPDHIWFADDIFGFRADWVDRFANELERLGGGLPFTIQTRADLVSEAMAAALSRAGCREVWLGAESGNQQVLNAMNKGTTVAEILQARQRLKDVGIRVGFFIQLGYLGEGLDELLDTRRLIEVARPDDIGVSVAYPLPGTRFHELVQAQLGTKTHWDDSADLAMMFRGSFTTEFYRQVRDLLHQQVELDTTPTPSLQSQAGLLRAWAELIGKSDGQRGALATTPMGQPVSKQASTPAPLNS